MTGDWTGTVQILRRVDVEGSEVPVVVLNNINLIVKIFYNIHRLLPDTSDRICNKKDSRGSYQLYNVERKK